MATPPYVSRADADEAVERIAQRRREIDDPHLDRLTDNPADMPNYLRRYTSEDTPDWVKRADAEDGLVIRLHLWWELEAFELWCLDLAYDTNVRARRVGQRLGIKSRAGVRDRRDRVRTKLGLLRTPDEKHARAERSADKTRAETEQNRSQWLREHQAELAELIGQLLDHNDLADSDETYDSLLELARDKRSGSYTGMMMWSLNEAVTGLLDEPKVRNTPGDHPVRTAITRAQALLDNYTTST